MSQSAVTKITPVLVKDKRLVWPERPKFGVVASGRLNRYSALPTQTYSTSNITFNAQPPSPMTAISREIKMQVEFMLTFTGTTSATGSGHLLDLHLYDAPRFLPIAQVTQSLAVTMNNVQVNQNNYQVVNALYRCNQADSDYKWDMSTAPSMPDSVQNYSDVYTLPSALGVARDPLQSAGQNSFYPTRGGWQVTVVSNPNVGQGMPATAVVRFTSCESLVLSPFTTTDDDEAALIGVQNLVVILNLLPDLSRVWSHSDYSAASTITSTVVTIPTPPYLLLNFLSPSELEVIPKSVPYSYSSVTTYPTDNISSTPAGASFTMNSQNIQLQSIPRRILVFIRRTDSTQSMTTTDTFARIDSLSITWDNQSGILSEANTQQLYLLSRNSSLNLSFEDWNQFVGSVLIIDVGRALVLNNAAEAPSLATTKQLSMVVQATNLNTTQAITFSLQIVVISDGIIDIGDNMAIPSSSVLTAKDILETKVAGHVFSFERSSNFYGGKFSRDLFNIGKKVADIAHKTHAVSTIAALTGHPEIAVPARALGYGLVGGRRVSKSALRAMAQHY
jgi:hypothetical protein